MSLFKLFKRNNTCAPTIKSHMKSNHGDENISKMIWVVIIFVVGAILLTLVTGAFKGKASDYYNGIVNSWFGNNQGYYDSVTGGSGGPSGGGEPGGETSDSIPIGPLPPGAKVNVGDKARIESGDIQDGDEIEYGDYTYKYNYYFSDGWEEYADQEGWGVRVVDASKSSYGVICSSIGGKPIVAVDCTFEGCTSLITSPVIPNSVTSMWTAFSGCSSLKAMPVIPEGVTNLMNAFSGCTALETTTAIPSTVTTLTFAFENCSSLTTAPDLSKANSLIELTNTFVGCSLLTTVSELPASLTHMQCAFKDCTSLKTAPALPSGVRTIYGMFEGCTSLETLPPVIPSNIYEMTNAFKGCTSVTGTITINASPSMYSNCFADTVKPITINGSSTKLAEIAATGNNGNVTAQ